MVGNAEHAGTRMRRNMSLPSARLRCILLVIALAGGGDLASIAGADDQVAVTWPAPTSSAAVGPRAVVTTQRGKFIGRSINYTASVEETILKSAEGAPAASLFTIAYIAEPRRGEQRPVAFVYNGGPGAASNTLNFG